jgi:hypothetical protein
VNKSRKPPISSQEQLANVYESLADDAADGLIETDEGTQQRGKRIARAAIDKAVGSKQTSGSDSEQSSQKEWTKRTDKGEPSARGQGK